MFSRSAEGSAVVVETLGPQYFDSGHLPGAINIPHTEVASLAPVMLPDRDAAIVTYCSNTACQNSAIVQAQLRAMGYTNVRKYAEGKQDWTDHGLQLEAAPAGAGALPRRDRTHADRGTPRRLLFPVPQGPDNDPVNPRRGRRGPRPPAPRTACGSCRSTTSVTRPGTHGPR